MRDLPNPHELPLLLMTQPSHGSQFPDMLKDPQVSTVMILDSAS